jgi:hypothetical protein
MPISTLVIAPIILELNTEAYKSPAKPKKLEASAGEEEEKFNLIPIPG